MNIKLKNCAFETIPEICQNLKLKIARFYQTFFYAKLTVLIYAFVFKKKSGVSRTRIVISAHIVALKYAVGVI